MSIGARADEELRERKKRIRGRLRPRTFHEKELSKKRGLSKRRATRRLKEAREPFKEEEDK